MIRASQGAVWALLTDGAGYREWNPEIVQVDGRIERGARITAHVRLGDGAVRRVPLRVSALEAPHRMEWTAGLPLGLFVGRRLFTLTACAGGVEFRLHLAMSRLLGPLILKSVGDRQAEIDSFSTALKLRCENIRP